MSQNNPSPTVRENALAIKAQLDTYAQVRGGDVKIMANRGHYWQEIFDLSKNPRILIVWNGEDARGEYAGGERTDLHRVDRKWSVAVLRGHGFKNLVADSEGTPGQPGYYEDFMDSVETVRDGIRVLQGISEEFPNNYISIQPLINIAPIHTGNVFLDGYEISFSTAADIPEILTNGTTG